MDTTGVADGDVLTYDSGGSEWVAAAPTGGGGATDRTIPTGGTLYTFDTALSGWTTTGSPTSDRAASSATYSVSQRLAPAARTFTACIARCLVHYRARSRRGSSAVWRTKTIKVAASVCESSPGDTYGFGMIFDGSRQWSRRLFPTPTTHTTGTNYGVTTDQRTDFWARMVINAAMTSTSKRRSTASNGTST